MEFNLPAPLVFADEVAKNVTVALAEDVGCVTETGALDVLHGDLTAQIIQSDTTAQARIIARVPMVLCGRPWVDATFARLSPGIVVDWQKAEGAHVEANETICTLSGPARALLTGERTALNFLQMLSAVATKTQHFVACVAGTSAKIVDTRKTLPGLRVAQKYAVHMGGGDNHRLALYDAILLKENHLSAAGGVAAAWQRAQEIAAERARLTGYPCRFIQIEVETLGQLKQALGVGADRLLLDNFTLAMMRRAVAINAKQANLEVSGNVTLKKLRAIAETGIDRISIGALTKDVTAIDLSMRFYE